MTKIKGLRNYKKYLIGTITAKNKKEINRLTRQIDKAIKRLLINENTTDTTNLATKTELQNGLSNKQDKGDYALKSEIPTNNNQLLNGAGYINADYHGSTKQDVINDLDTIRQGAELGATALQSVPAEYVTETELNDKGYLTSYTETDPVYTADKPNLALKSEIPTKVSSLANDANYQTDTDVASMIASIPQFELKIVDTLPLSGQKMVLYLVPKTSASGDDIYDEYVWLESTSSFELVGSSGGGGATLDNYLPDGTVITVNLDGSGDFTDLPSAIDYLTDKFSSGTVTIQLGDGTFELANLLDINTNNFNFSNLTIQGSGKDVTTVYKASSGSYQPIIRVLNSGAVIFKDLKIKSDKANNGRGLLFDSADAIVQNIGLESFAQGAIYVSAGSICRLKGTIDFTNCTIGLEVNGANISTSFGATFNTSSVGTLVSAMHGGIVQLTYCYYTGSPTKTTNQTIGTATVNGLIVGSLTKQ